MATGTEAALDQARAYHATAREEIVARVGHRDTSLALFLAAVGVLLGSVLGGDAGLTDANAGVLYFVPILGLGATLVHVHHNNVIGALGVYLGKELDGAVRVLLASLPDPPRVVPPDWDGSATLHRPTVHPSPRRLIAGILILLLPQVGALAMAVAELPPSSLSIGGSISGGVAAVTSLWLLAQSDAERRRMAHELRDHRQANDG